MKTTTLNVARAGRGLRTYMAPLAALVPVIACLVVVTHRYTADQVATVKAAAEAELSTVLDLQEGRLGAWHRERLANAISLRNSVFLAEALEAWLRGRAPGISGEKIETWLRSLATHYGYSSVAIARVDGTIAAQWPAGPDDNRLSAEALGTAAEAHRRRAPALRRGDAHQDPNLLHIFAPVYRPADDTSVATLVFEVEVEASTAAVVARWPVPRKSAVISALVADGPEWRYVSPPRRAGVEDEPPLLAPEVVRRLLERPGQVQTIAVPGHAHEVIAAAKPVAGTTWAVLVQIDEDEVLALARARGLAAVLLVALVSTVLAVATGVLVAQLSRAARRREAALRSALTFSAEVSEQKFRAAFRSSGLGSALLDREGIILEANRALLDLLGETHEDLTGRPMFDLSAPDERERARAQFAELQSGTRDYYRSDRTYRARGDRVEAHVVLRVSAIREADGALQLALVLVEDVTEVKSLQAQLALADRMASVGTLAAGVAHEINNPLAFVLANIGYAEEELATPAHDAGEIRQALAEAREGARRVRQIVMDLKTFAREDERAASVTDVGEAIRFALSLVQNELRHRARVEVRVEEGIPTVRGSEHRIGQVLVNLLVNAAHAIESGHASVNVISVTARRLPDGRVEIAVSDSGAGMSPEVVPRIFEPFFTTKPVGRGTGLGLAICHGIVSKLGGELRVESTVGVGSTFYVALPAVPSAACGGVTIDGASGAALRARVLVVDDEPLVARSVARVLGGHCDIDAVQDGATALARIAERRPDVILCDIMMPEASGPELYANLAQRFPELTSRTIFLTGGAFTDEARTFLARVTSPVVQKPFEPEQLRRAVRSALSGSPPSKAAA